MSKDAKTFIVGLSLFWFGLGFVGGLCETMDERSHTTCSGEIGKDWHCVGDGKSGCVYESLSVFVSPGRVIACELFRRRFSVEGFGSIVERKNRD